MFEQVDSELAVVPVAHDMVIRPGVGHNQVERPARGEHRCHLFQSSPRFDDVLDDVIAGDDGVRLRERLREEICLPDSIAEAPAGTVQIS